MVHTCPTPGTTLADVDWEVVKSDDSAVTFRYPSPDGRLEARKTFALRKGDNEHRDEDTNGYVVDVTLARPGLSYFGVVLDKDEAIFNDLPMIESIRRLLEHLLPTHYEEITFQREGFNFSAPIEESLLKEGGPFVLALRGAGTLESLRKRIEAQAKISSIEDMRELVRFADRGVPTRYAEHPPAEIPRSADYNYFIVESGDPRWKKIRDASNFCFYLADAEPELSVRLFVVLPRGRRQR